jgi:hypothetical protein
MSGRRISRRNLFGAVAIATGLPAAGQQAAAPPPIPSTPEEELAAARAQARSNAEQIAKVKLTTAVEPAAHFTP